MPGNYQRHLDDFGFCDCDGRDCGTEMLELETQDEHGRWRVERMRSCGCCFGLL